MNDTWDELPEILTSVQAAEFLRMTRPAVNDLARQGKIKPLKNRSIRRSYVFPRMEVLKYLERVLV